MYYARAPPAYPAFPSRIGPHAPRRQVIIPALSLTLSCRWISTNGSAVGGMRNASLSLSSLSFSLSFPPLSILGTHVVAMASSTPPARLVCMGFCSRYEGCTLATGLSHPSLSLSLRWVSPSFPALGCRHFPAMISGVASFRICKAYHESKGERLASHPGHRAERRA